MRELEGEARELRRANEILREASAYFAHAELDRRLVVTSRTVTSPPSISRVRVRYAETDKMGVVYYANYFVWFEVGRTDLLRQAGWSYREMEADPKTRLFGPAQGAGPHTRYMCSTIAFANPEHDTSVAPSIRRWKS